MSENDTRRVKLNAAEEATPEVLMLLNSSMVVRAAMSSNAIFPDRLFPTLDCEIPMKEPGGSPRTIRVVLQIQDAETWLNIFKAMVTLPLPFLFPDEVETAPEEMKDMLHSFQKKQQQRRAEGDDLPN